MSEAQQIKKVRNKYKGKVCRAPCDHAACAAYEQTVNTPCDACDDPLGEVDVFYVVPQEDGTALLYHPWCVSIPGDPDAGGEPPKKAEPEVDESGIPVNEWETRIPPT